MVTMLEGVLPKSKVLLCVFVGKRTQCKNIHKEMFSVYGGKCLSRKVVHNWVADVLLMTDEIETEVRKCLRQQSEDW
jgi:hypothetical protein